jgi:SAM-dependent methyltransferase
MNQHDEKNAATLKHRFHSPFAVASQLLQGGSLIRTLFNLALREHQIRGEVLDLGSKTQKASYYEFLRVSPGTRITCTDLNHAPGVIPLDVEATFPLSSQSFDTVLAFHLFEHVFHFQKAPYEVFRILRPGGTAFVAVPFLHEYHADPEDYVRFTDTGLRRTWEQAGFSCKHIEAIGEGLLTTFLTKLPAQILPRSVRAVSSAFLYLLSTGGDRLIARRPLINGRSVPQRFAVEFFAVFEKPI